MKKKIGKIYLEKDNKNYFIVDGDSNLIKKNNELSINDLVSSNDSLNKKSITISGACNYRLIASEDQATEEYLINIIDTHFKNPDELSDTEYMVYSYLCIILEHIPASNDFTINCMFDDLPFSKTVVESNNNEYNISIDGFKDTDVPDAELEIMSAVVDILKQYFKVDLVILFPDLTIEFPDKFIPKYSIIWNYGFSGYYKQESGNSYSITNNYYFPVFDNTYGENNEYLSDYQKSITLFNSTTNTKIFNPKNFTNLFFVLNAGKESIPQLFKLNFINKLSTHYYSDTYTQYKVLDSTESVSSLNLDSEQPM